MLVQLPVRRLTLRLLSCHLKGIGEIRENNTYGAPLKQNGNLSTVAYPILSELLRHIFSHF